MFLKVKCGYLSCQDAQQVNSRHDVSATMTEERRPIVWCCYSSHMQKATFVTFSAHKLYIYSTLVTTPAKQSRSWPSHRTDLVIQTVWSAPKARLSDKQLIWRLVQKHRWSGVQDPSCEPTSNDPIFGLFSEKATRQFWGMSASTMSAKVFTCEDLSQVFQVCFMSMSMFWFSLAFTFNKLAFSAGELHVPCC